MSTKLYYNFLEITSGRYSAIALSDVSEAHCKPKEIWKVSKDNILWNSGVIIVDDTVIQKNCRKK